MSWQSYVDVQICEHVQCKLACIVGLEDGALWGKFCESGLDVSPSEAKAIADCVKSNPKQFLENGIHLSGEKYICISVDQNLIRGRRGSSALCIVITKKAVLFAATVDGFPPGKLNTVLEKLGEYLVSNNF